MPAEFRAVNERMVLNKYFDPINHIEVRQMMLEDSAYAKQMSHPILVMADFSEVKHFPPNLITMALQLGNINPVRNPEIELILVITNSAFVANIISVLVRITGVGKMVVVRTREEADRIAAAQLKKH